MWKVKVSVFLFQAKPTNGESMYLGTEFNNRILILKIELLVFMKEMINACRVCILCDL